MYLTHNESHQKSYLDEIFSKTYQNASLGNQGPSLGNQVQSLGKRGPSRGKRGPSRGKRGPRDFFGKKIAIF